MVGPVGTIIVEPANCHPVPGGAVPGSVLDTDSQVRKVSRVEKAELVDTVIEGNPVAIV